MDLSQLFSRTPSEKSQLALFWGKDSFSLAETAKGFPDKIFSIRFDAPIPGDQGQKIPDSLRYTALLQGAMRDKKLISKKINLSLSSRDVIYRSFIIPFMQPNEVKNVVDFEATKYIPLKLEELAYTFHAIPYTEGQQKNLRILFVAARKLILERYTGVLQQAGFETDLIEPASVSLTRVLQKNGHISKQQSTALIEIEPEGGGRITVIDREIVQFVREFQSAIEGIGIPAENAKFFNDIRVSYNFYQRQNPHAKLDKIVILAPNDLAPLATGLSQEFKIPAVSLSISSILKDQQTDLSGLCAYGACIRERTASSKNFDLSIKVRAVKGGESLPGITGWNFKNLAIGVGSAAALVLITSFGTKALLKNAQAQTESLSRKLGIYASSPISNLEELKTNALAKLDQYKNIPYKSEISKHLKEIPFYLPEGAWINNFTIDHFETTETTETGPQKVLKAGISFDGFIYLPNTNNQIRQVNALVAKLKNDKNFSTQFKEISLSNVRQENHQNFPVTSFRISCR